MLTVPKPKPMILDCTLRDGGLTNEFNFPELFVTDCIRMLALSRVDYIELGYKANPALYDRADYGKLKFCKDDDITDLITEVIHLMGLTGIGDLPKFSFMVDVGRFDREAIADAHLSPFAMSRVACYLNQIDEAIDDVAFFQTKGYETTLNIMAISREGFPDIAQNLKKIRERIPFVTVYVVDSYGALYPDEVQKLVSLYKEELAGMRVGIHCHNNMQLAFSNTITAMGSGAEFLDASVGGMGRGAGNCPLELLLPYVDKTAYDLKPTLTLINAYYATGGEDRTWGYCPKQLLTGIFNQHPVKSIQGAGEDLIRIYDHFQSGVTI